MNVAMVHETNNLTAHRAERDDEITPARVDASLNASLVTTQRAAATLRAFLDDNNLAHYRIFDCSNDGELFEAEWYLESLGEAAAWESLGSLVEGGEPIAYLQNLEHGQFTFESGVMRLSRHHLVMARWQWSDVEDRAQLKRLCLIAARSPGDVSALREEMTRHRHIRHAGVWQIVRGYAWNDGPQTKRETADELLLDESILKRVEIDIVGFFREEVKAMYRSMGVPWRRGVLLHGLPGNGKSSLIRLIGARLMHLPALILRQAADFDSDDLEEVIRRWTAQAPAILVIEDLNWVMEAVQVSTFLNVLDGIDRRRSGGKGADSAIGDGLLLIATTNHPDKLDPAINNRPGRFDVVVEVPPPGEPLRLEFLRRTLQTSTEPMLQAAASRTNGLSFAHLQEIVRQSGLSAIHAGRERRSESDVLEAIEMVRATHEEACAGFPRKPEQPFGLLPLRRKQ